MSTGSHHSSDLHDPAELAHRIQEMGKWFHNLNLNGVYTAPDHFLGDFPNIKWQKIRQEIPASLAGKSVLDIGCNGGFYSIEMKRRGAGSGDEHSRWHRPVHFFQHASRPR